jgi:GTPase SAR1 family protein
MNREKVAKMQGKKVRVRPIARRIEGTGRELPLIDDWWHIESSSREKLKLVNPRTSHFVTLGTDHIREFMSDYEGGSDGFLLLKSQIILKGASVYVEPWIQQDLGKSHAAPR